MSTLADGGRINEQNVREEIDRLRSHWHPGTRTTGGTIDLTDYLSEEQLADIDQLDQWQLLRIIEVCRQSRSLSEAGRQLFDRSRLRKRSVNDSHRLRQTLTKFGLRFESIVDR